MFSKKIRAKKIEEIQNALKSPEDLTIITSSPNDIARNLRELLQNHNSRLQFLGKYSSILVDFFYEIASGEFEKEIITFFEKTFETSFKTIADLNTFLVQNDYVIQVFFYDRKINLQSLQKILVNKYIFQHRMKIVQIMHKDEIAFFSRIINLDNIDDDSKATKALSKSAVEGEEIKNEDIQMEKLAIVGQQELQKSKVKKPKEKSTNHEDLLTERERKVLSAIKRRGFLKRDTVIRLIWGQEPVSADAVDQFVSRMRRKLAKSGQKDLIRVRKGKGIEINRREVCSKI